MFVSSLFRILLLLVCIAAPFVTAAETLLTRFGPVTYGPDIVMPNVTRSAFFGVTGEATLVMTVDSADPRPLPDRVSMQLNGALVWDGPGSALLNGPVNVPVTLQETNALRVEVVGVERRALTARVVQPVDMDLSLAGRVHFNISTSNFERAREFYRTLGFADQLGGFPRTNTIEVSRGVGIRSLYDMYAELIFLGYIPQGHDLLTPTGRFIDLIEWTEPRNEAPPYPNTYRLGINRMVFDTTHLDADMQRMQNIGASFLSAPATSADGRRWVIGRDPDGIFFELSEQPGAMPVLKNGSYVTRIDHLTINVADLERSVAFYEMMGFEQAARVASSDSMAEAAAMGLSEPARFRGRMLSHRSDGSRVKLVEWLQPRDLTPPNPHPITHYGIQRINYASTDLEGDIRKLTAQGAQFLSPIAPCCEGDASTFGFILLFDPDGNFFQLMGDIEPASAAAAN